jgi:hypothetical protein
MGRTVQCPADQWTVIFNHAFVQIPRVWTISFVAADGGTVTGEVVERRSSWIFPKPPITLPLVATMSFERGWWNTFYSVYVKPTHDVIAQIR